MHPALTPWSSLAGGAIIGVAASLLWFANGRVAGISGISGGLFSAPAGDRSWRLEFLVGLACGGLLLVVVRPLAFVNALPRSPLALIVAGLLVGFGTSLGSGCTSGHGVCGISRGSLRSVLATATFLFTGAVTVACIQRLAGGRL